MSNLVFEFDENMMAICLIANEWSKGWDDARWASPNGNADYADYSTKDAFQMLLTSKNLYGRQFESGWKVK